MKISYGQVKPIRLANTILIAVLPLSSVSAAIEVCPESRICESGDRDKTGTIAIPKMIEHSQGLGLSRFESDRSLKAEGTGFEPATGCPAPEFQSGC